MFTFAPISEPTVKEKIILNGREIGTVLPYVPTYGESEDKFQVQLHFSNMEFSAGFGPTKEAAIAAAVKNAGEKAATLASEAMLLELEIEAAK